MRISDWSSDVCSSDLSLEEEFGERFVRSHRNCLVARHELVELRREPDGHVHAILRHGTQPLEVSRRCVAGRQEIVKRLQSGPCTRQRTLPSCERSSPPSTRQGLTDDKGARPRTATPPHSAPTPFRNTTTPRPPK